MKFIIDIPEKDVQGCYCCPFNYDCIECAAPNGPDYVDICDYLRNHNITTRPEGCPLVPVMPDQEEMDRNWPETVGELLGACERLSSSRDLYTLARALVTLAKSIYYDLDYGKPWDEIAEDAKKLMEGAMELWERMVSESE